MVPWKGDIVVNKRSKRKEQMKGREGDSTKESKGRKEKEGTYRMRLM
jgi:hypothetical protein